MAKGEREREKEKERERGRGKRRGRRRRRGRGKKKKREREQELGRLELGMGRVPCSAALPPYLTSAVRKGFNSRPDSR